MQKVSIVISTWNRVADLEKCVDSIIEQDYKNIELVIVDNASIDKTYFYCSEIKNTLDIDVIYYRMINSSYTAMETLNFGFNLASGEYILVVDDDAYLRDNNLISLLVNDLENNKNAAIVGSNVQRKQEDDSGVLSLMPIRTKDGRMLNSEEISNLGTIKYYEFHGACALFRNYMVKKVGYYDKGFNIYSNEFDLAGKMLNLGYDVLFDSEAVVIHSEYSSFNCNLKHRWYIRNFNTCILRNFRGIFCRLKTICFRTPMSFVLWYQRTGYKCSNKMKLWFVILTFFELIRSVYRSFFPDITNIYPDQEMQEYLEQSMYNSFKQNTIYFIKELVKN
jgi:GT2 family glycosyltransferase